MKAPINYQIIQKRNLKSSLWEGGETFEYYIYPKNSNYAARDFLFRISSATIQKRLQPSQSLRSTNAI